MGVSATRPRPLPQTRWRKAGAAGTWSRVGGQGWGAGPAASGSTSGSRRLCLSATSASFFGERSFTQTPLPGVPRLQAPDPRLCGRGARPCAGRSCGSRGARSPLSRVPEPGTAQVAWGHAAFLARLSVCGHGRALRFAFSLVASSFKMAPGKHAGASECQAQGGRDRRGAAVTGAGEVPLGRCLSGLSDGSPPEPSAQEPGVRTNAGVQAEAHGAAARAGAGPAVPALRPPGVAQRLLARLRDTSRNVSPVRAL